MSARPAVGNTFLMKTLAGAITAAIATAGCWGAMKYIKENYPNDITTETSIGLSFGIVFIAAILVNLLML
jgi:hypothetical protein